MGSRRESNMAQENHITSGKRCNVNVNGGRNYYKLKGEVGTSIPGSLQDHDEVIVWQGKHDMLGGIISESLDNSVEMLKNEEIHDSLPLGSVPLSRLQSLTESKTGLESGGNNSTSKQKQPTIFIKVQRIKDQGMDKNEQIAGIGVRAPGKEEVKHTVSKQKQPTISSKVQRSKDQAMGKNEQIEGIGVRAPGKKEVKHTGIQVEGKDENQQRQSGNCGVYKGQIGKKVKNYEIVGMNEKDNVKGQLCGSAEVMSRKFEENGESGICVFLPFLFENGRPQSVKKGVEKIAEIVVVNNGKDSAKLSAVELVDTRPSTSFSLSHKVDTKSMKTQHNTGSISLVRGPWLIEPRYHLTLNLSCKAKDIGLLKTSIIFDFQDQKITQHVILLAEDDVSEQLAPVEPYRRLKKGRQYKLGRILRGVHPSLTPFPNKLKPYNIPHGLKEMGVKKIPRVLERGLSMKTYSKYFSTLLYLEELQIQNEMSAYDMDNATMRISGQYLVLKVPGLSEKRPSLVYGDEIYATPCQANDSSYQGYIHRIEANQIYVKFNKSFHKDFTSELQYNVRFSCCRTKFRRCHKAVESACRIDESFLFPSIPLARTCVNVSRIIPFNRYLNKEQLFAVHQIVNCTSLPPYLIYGPPGTGKTATLIEAILQVLRSNVKACILACAPSNVASDLFVERLIGPVQKGEIFRLNAISRPYKDVSHQILPYCYYKDSMFLCPPLEDLLNYKIIVSTFVSASILDSQGLPQGHFTHIFLDESGQGTEPETMVPIANLANTETTVVLAGDPQQLGPVIHSPIAAKFGLGKSYLERLLELHLYALDGGNNQFVTKLVRNYRSHPAILELPSQLFYGNMLIACAANGIKNLLSGWDEVPNKKFPVVFVGIEGCEEREGTSPSWFNRVEVSKVLDIVKKIKNNKRNSVIGKDIGVITPYHQQVVKLKKAFAANALSDVKIGSVEQFQGDEKLVIIISTVRSRYENEESDKKCDLGFIGNPRRFNVAVTRAKSLLVVVGNPYMLRKDKYWNELLQYCVSHKSYLGCLLPPKTK